MPGPRKAREEAHLAVRGEKILEITRRYIEEECDEKGKVLRGALSESQERGLVKLQRRVKEGEVVLRTTDKSKKMCASDLTINWAKSIIIDTHIILL